MTFKKITLLSLALLFTHFLFSQYCNNQSGQTSSFDWTAEEWQVWVRPTETQSPVLRYVRSPYHPIGFASQPNTQHIEDDPGEADYLASDGWVLVAEDMGFDVNHPVRFPQFVLYNHTIVVEQFMRQDQLPGLDEFSLLIEESEKKRE